MIENKICLEECQRGWKCALAFYVSTRRQFTDEYVYVKGFGKWWWSSWWNARKAMRKAIIRLQAKPGGYDL